MPGFSWTELYTMPVDLRRFYYKCVVQKIQASNEQAEEQERKNKAR